MLLIFILPIKIHLKFVKYLKNYQKKGFNYIKKSISKNTQKSTLTWANRFKVYINYINPDFNLDTSEDKVAIASLLSEFIIQVKTLNNTDYFANSLYVEVC